MPLSGLAPSKPNFFQKKLKIGYVYINESFDTIFNMDFGPGKSPMDELVNVIINPNCIGGQICPGILSSKIKIHLTGVITL